MRQLAWYSPEYNWIVLQSIMDDSIVRFEWNFEDMGYAFNLWGPNEDPMHKTTWIPLGEL